MSMDKKVLADAGILAQSMTTWGREKPARDKVIMVIYDKTGMDAKNRLGQDHDDALPFLTAHTAGQAIGPAEAHEGVAGIEDADDEDGGAVEEVGHERQSEIADVVAVHVEHVKGFFVLRPAGGIAHGDHDQVEDDGQEADEQIARVEMDAIEVDDDDRRQGDVEDNRRNSIKSAAPEKAQLF